MEYMNHRYMIQRHGKTAGHVAAAAAAAAADDDDDDGDDDDRRERSILVTDVPVDLVDAVLCVLESERKGGGAVEQQKRDCCTGAMLFTFVSKDGQSCSFHGCSFML